jgi:hypothetical protein
MEILIFLVGITAVMLFIARDRIGGPSRSKVEQGEFDANHAIGYGASVAPPGTSPGASVNAPWFAKPRANDAPRNHGAD